MTRTQSGEGRVRVCYSFQGEVARCPTQSIANSALQVIGDEKLTGIESPEAQLSLSATRSPSTPDDGQSTAARSSCLITLSICCFARTCCSHPATKLR